MPTVASTPSAQWLVWRDFTPGIYTRTGADAPSIGNAPANLGAATLENTYRCIGLPQGGLAPLPARTFDRSIGVQNSGTNVTVGAGIMGPMAEVQGKSTPIIYDRSTSLHAAYLLTGVGGMTTAIAPSGAWSVAVDKLDVGSTGQTLIETINTSTAPPPTHYSAVWVVPYSRFTTASIYSHHWVYSYSLITNGSGGVGLGQIIPPTTNTSATTPQTISGINANVIANHQTRLLMSYFNQPTVAGSITFLNTGQMVTDSIIAFTDPNSATLASASPLVPDSQVFTGIGVMQSLTASDLLIVQQSGGAQLIQGDMGAPIIRRLPNVPSTNGLTCEGASTPLGFAYIQNRGGAYLWQGGDGAVLLSPQLDDDFWYVTNTDIVQQFAGVVAFWRDYILFPNNWLFDTKTQSWWQIELQSTLTYWIWRVNPLTNMLYGFVATYAQNATNVSGWSPVTQATNYSWQSQPFYPNEDQYVRSMELVLVAQGAGTVTFTITGLDDPVTNLNTVAITTTGTKPKYYRANLNGAQGTALQIRVVSDGGSSPAPVIHEFRYAYTPAQPVPAP